MLIDLLSPANYIMVNRDAIRILGLNTAVYCSELLTIYKKVVQKDKFLDDKFFKVDRKYITQQTSLDVKEQLKCDLNLQKVNIIKINQTDPDIIFFDVETFSSILASEDIKLLDNVSQKVKQVNPKGTSDAARKRTIQALKDSIRCNTYPVLLALRDWIDSVMADPKKYLSCQQVQVFKDKLDDFCNGDLDLALKLIEIATVHQYIDCQWAINAYQKDRLIQSNISRSLALDTRQSTQRRTVSVGSEEF